MKKNIQQIPGKTTAFTCLITSCLIVFSALRAGAANAGVIIPAPVQVVLGQGQFELTAASRIVADRALKNEAQLLAVRLRLATGYPIKLKSTGARLASGDIRLAINAAAAGLGAEGYDLSVNTNGVVIRAPAAAGVFYGTQSLLQLLPPEIFSTRRASGVAWKIPCLQIEDQPRFGWRGFMLDVSRHFFTKVEVEKVLDLMALYKLNTFHWHLVDDQGWRIEIKKYPRLTSVGAWRADIGFGLDPKSSTAYDSKGRYGGFYTQKEIREVVAYAAARHIMIVPEIEMPGHSGAALVAYPQYVCPTARNSVPDRVGAYGGVYCAGNDETFVFLGNILNEVAGLFPGTFIHIGGDEVQKANWKACPECQARLQHEGLKNEAELQSWFTRRIETIVNAHGKRLIGWSEIREGGLAPSAALMDWIGGGAESAASGHDVVMTPTTHCYFDHCQSTNHAGEPLSIGGYLPLERVYQFDPMPAKLAPEFRCHVLGGQANLWTEYVPNLRQVEYMMFPRLGALSEADWSPTSTRDWEDFKTRTELNEKRLNLLGVNYRSLAKPD